MEVELLFDFFVKAFSADELRRFVLRQPYGKRLLAEVPETPFEIAAALERRNLIDIELVEQLEADRPQRTQDLAALRQADWEIETH